MAGYNSVKSKSKEEVKIMSDQGITVKVVDGKLVDVASGLVVGVPLEVIQQYKAEAKVVEGVLADIHLLDRTIKDAKVGFHEVAMLLIRNILGKLTDMSLLD